MKLGKSLPSSSNVHAFVDDLCSSTCYAQLAVPDFHHILLHALQHSCTKEDLIIDVLSLKHENNLLPKSEAECFHVYFWNLKYFYTQLWHFFKIKRYCGAQDFSHAINCKKQTQELASLFSPVSIKHILNMLGYLYIEICLFSLWLCYLAIC